MRLILVSFSHLTTISTPCVTAAPSEPWTLSPHPPLPSLEGCGPVSPVLNRRIGGRNNREPWQVGKACGASRNEPGLLSWLVFAHLSLIFPTDTPLPHTGRGEPREEEDTN